MPVFKKFPARGSVMVRTPRRGSVTVRSMGQCRFSNFSFNSRRRMSKAGRKIVLLFTLQSSSNKKLRCRRQAVRCFVFVSTVVSFNSVNPRVQSIVIVNSASDLLLRTKINAALQCLRRNVEASCHKHFVVVSREKQTPPLTSE